MELWQFIACLDGYAASRGTKPQGRELSDERLAELGIEGFD